MGGIPGGGRCNLGHFLALKDYVVAIELDLHTEYSSMVVLLA